MSVQETKQHTLKNGLQLLGYVMPHSKSAALAFFVKTGARDEKGKEAGVSHFLEHMMFKGTAKRSALDITYQLGNIGAQANAFTSEENTVYYAPVMPENFGALQELLSDMLRPSLDSGEFETEKKVILEEIALYKDRPTYSLHEQATADFYGGHPAGNSVLGSTDSIAALTRDEMKQYFDRRYAPSNITVVASGNFSWDSFVTDAEKFCGGWKDFPAKREHPAFTPQIIERQYRKDNLQQAHMLFLSGGPCWQDEERYPFGVLSTILGDSTGSKLYWSLIDSGLADSAGCDSDESDAVGAFSVYVSTEPSRAPEVASIVREIMGKPLDFDEADLARAKTKLATKIVLNGELPMGRLFGIGTTWTYLKEIYDLKVELQKVQAITKNDIAKALERFPLKEWGEFQLLPS